MMRYLVKYSKVQDMDTRLECYCSDEELIAMIRNRINVVIWSAEWIKVDEQSV